MDIRLVRGRESRVWLWTGMLAGLSLLVLVSAYVFGDRTMSAKKMVGAAAGFGSDRTPVLPMQTDEFESLLPLDTRELGRLVHMTATTQSVVRGNSVWVRTPSGRRILVRFEPDPDASAFRGMGPGSRLDVNGYLQKLSRAELELWTDTLGVVIPRPTPGVKFGDLPDSGFAKIDSLFIKDFYLSVRPEGLRAVRSTTQLRPDTSAGAAAPMPLPTLTDSAAAVGAALGETSSVPAGAQGAARDSARPEPVPQAPR
ncbi:hypothetical protein [Longimicrobium terrae]|uniref:Uncharacterized protein n=1 Tax=Longimicrobium terrae TaxID=1639882 RepID=A0A841GXM7_9BACT|nr:hypothetical protein [Longimicrobium terrae]MBB4636116.1 hypothetical protein [Longimicrobium terrae]MBB6070511.1 hypothetical protein [Longimicrobium terrae]NNC29501.1 hypothetical protein [Longimicrobium terrae]